jgi:hypothetical protein
MKLLKVGAGRIPSLAFVAGGRQLLVDGHAESHRISNFPPTPKCVRLLSIW